VVEQTLQARAERLAETHFLGGPTWTFERVGRHVLEVLLKEGVTTTSNVLDVGCGALRLGYWLMRMLDSGHYFGIEPNEEMLGLGLQELVEPDVVERADAHFSANDDFDFSVFGESFDYVVARSIWTHASRGQISAMLESFAATAAPKGVFLTSYYPAGFWFTVGHRWPRLQRVVTKLPLDRMTPLLASAPSIGRSREYTEDGWIGRSHQSGDAGAARHGLRWITTEAARHGLTVRLMPYRVIHHQYWLRISR
jgi:SAM-dependent methyltransferase